MFSTTVLILSLLTLRRPAASPVVWTARVTFPSFWPSLETSFHVLIAERWLVDIVKSTSMSTTWLSHGRKRKLMGITISLGYPKPIFTSSSKVKRRNTFLLFMSYHMSMSLTLNGLGPYIPFNIRSNTQLKPTTGIDVLPNTLIRPKGVPFIPPALVSYIRPRYPSP